jgi:hypothetical protein
MTVGEEVQYTVPVTLQKEPIKVQHLIRMLPHYDAISASVAHTLHTCAAAVRQDICTADTYTLLTLLLLLNI